MYFELENFYMYFETLSNKIRDKQTSVFPPKVTVAYEKKA